LKKLPTALHKDVNAAILRGAISGSSNLFNQLSTQLQRAILLNLKSVVLAPGNCLAKSEEAWPCLFILRTGVLEMMLNVEAAKTVEDQRRTALGSIESKAPLPKAPRPSVGLTVFTESIDTDNFELKLRTDNEFALGAGSEGSLARPSTFYDSQVSPKKSGVLFIVISIIVKVTFTI